MPKFDLHAGADILSLLFLNDFFQVFLCTVHPKIL